MLFKELSDEAIIGSPIENLVQAPQKIIRKMKRLISLLLPLLISGMIYAVPAKRIVYEVKQSDGSVISVLKYGDENHHHYQTIDGIIVIENTKGDFVYQVGESADKDIIAHNPEQRTAHEKSLIKAAAQSKISTKTTPANRMQLPARLKNTTQTNSRSLVILVQFKDKSFSMADPKAEYEKRYNDDSGTFASVRQYFKDNSNGKFIPEYVIAGPVTVSREYAYYGANNAYGDVRPRDMVAEACKLADKDVDFSTLERDIYGNVGSVYILYAGEGEASSADKNTIWPHSSSLYPSLKLDGVNIFNYACSNEITQGQIDGIGTFCHEFSHILGLPDFYDTDYAQNGQSYDPGPWSVMASGCYNDNSNRPCFYSALERQMMKWNEPVILDKAGKYTLPHIGTSNQSYQINTNSDKEYFLLENRQLTSWDAGLPYHGMLIYHIDKSNMTAWNSNTVNINPNHQYADIEEADNKRVIYTGLNPSQYVNSLKGDPYPGLSGNDSFTDDSTPNSVLWTGARTSKPITRIQETDGLISFDFMGGIYLPAPIAQPASNIENDRFVALWNNVENASAYEISIYTKTASDDSDSLYYEFDNIPSTADGWELNQIGKYTGSPYFGASAPALKFENGSVLGTPLFSKEASSISFCLVNTGDNSGGNQLLIEASNGNDWFKMGRFDVTGVNTLKRTVRYDASSTFWTTGLKMFRFTYEKIGSGNLAFDDLTIQWEFDGTKTFIPGYENLNVGNVQQVLISGLNSGTKYYYQVRAIQDDFKSEYSAEQAVSTTGPNSNTLNQNKTAAYAIHRTVEGISIISPATAIATIYSITGIPVAKVELHEGDNPVVLPQRAIYIVRIGETNFKIAY